jgi:hypothetical protein
MTETVITALKRARGKAMKYTTVARIPECGVFGEIAQDLAWAVDQIEAARHRDDCQQRLGDDGRCGICGWNANTQTYETV